MLRQQESVPPSVSQPKCGYYGRINCKTVSAGTITSGVYNPGTIAATQDTPEQRLVSVNLTQGDAVPTSAATLGANPNFGSLTTYAAGDKDTLAGTVTSAGVLTVTAGVPVQVRLANL